MNYKIGEFSRINKISKRMLRYYDEHGLLRPIKDQVSGYRLYSQSDINKMSLILKLRRYDFTIREMKLLLNAEEGMIDNALRKKVNEIEIKTSNYLDVLDDLKSEVGSESKNENKYTVSTGTEMSYGCIFIRKKISLTEIDRLLDELLSFIENQGITTLGKHMCIYQGLDENVIGEFDIEIRQPIVGKFNEVNELFKYKKCEKVTFVSTIHFGPYDKISNAYSCLHNFCIKEGHKIFGSFHEVYLTDEFVTLNSDDFVTLVKLPIKSS